MYTFILSQVTLIDYFAIGFVGVSHKNKLGSSDYLLLKASKSMRSSSEAKRLDPLC